VPATYSEINGLKQQSENTVTVSKSIKCNIKEVARNRLQCKLQYDVSKKAELYSECLCFHEFPERRFERNGASHIFHPIPRRGISSSNSGKSLKIGDRRLHSNGEVNHMDL
jgi:hypothetical protein